MTIGELIAQLRTIQDSFGDLPVWLEGNGVFYAPASQVLYCKADEGLALTERVEISGVTGVATLAINVSDSAALGEQLG